MPDAVPGFVPDWPLPSGIEAWQTCRGTGPMPYGGFNLGQHVGDDPSAVAFNRNQLLKVVPTQPLWLNQVHGTRVLELPMREGGGSIEADAVMTTAPDVVCAVMTADCLPVLLADKAGRVVGAAHAGWRGLAAGVLEALIHKMTASVNALPQDLVAWLGPAIGPTAFEVGNDVRDTFVSLDPLNHLYLKPGAADKWLADLSAIATAKLQAIGVSSITPSDCCTYAQSERFYSFRRDQVTGRMATMIWIKPRAL